MNASVATAGKPKKLKNQSYGRTVFTTVGYVWIILVVLAAIFAPLISPYGMMEQNLNAVMEGPTAAHWLGTDTLGRDVLTRLMYGAQPTLIAVAIAVAVYTLWGGLMGLLSGYLAGWTDRVVSVIASILLAMPHIIILFVFLSVYRGNVYVAMLVFGFIASPVMILVVRSSALSLRGELFVDAAKVSGLSSFYIIFRHIFPRTMGLIIVQATVFAANAIVLESALSFLGFGVQQPDPSWGNMVSEAATQMSLNAWMIYPTGAIIALTALSLGIVGDSIRDRVSGGWTQSALTRGKKHGEAGQVQAADSSRVLLDVRDLNIGYRVKNELKEVVHDVSFTLEKGKTLGIVGESGSGKTTVAFGILGVPGDNVVISKGQVLFENTDLLQMSDAQLTDFRGKRIGYVAQEPMVALDPNYKVGDLLRETLAINDDLKGEAANQRVIELLNQVELVNPERVAGLYPHELSGGMAQRVSIAFALAGRPDLILMDEPTTALDVTVQAGILALLHRLREETGLSIIVITHDFGVVSDLCDDVVVMYRGEIVEKNTAQEIYSHPKHDYTKALLASNPHNAKPGEDLPVITGTFTTPRTTSIPTFERKGSK